MTDQVVKCPTCGKIYMFRSVSSDTRNQSACPECVDAAEKTMRDYQEKVNDYPVILKEMTKNAE